MADTPGIGGLRAMADPAVLLFSLESPVRESAPNFGVYQ